MPTQSLMNGYENCMLCGRACGVNRNHGEIGFCNSTNVARISRAALHMWEEPPISGTKGSGTIFFTGCSLSCVFCQNRQISDPKKIVESAYRTVDSTELAEIMLKLQKDGAHNINFVTPTHYAPTVVDSVIIARKIFVIDFVIALA